MENDSKNLSVVNYAENLIISRMNFSLPGLSMIWKNYG